MLLQVSEFKHKVNQQLPFSKHTVWRISFYDKAERKPNFDQVFNKLTK